MRGVLLRTTLRRSHVIGTSAALGSAMGSAAESGLSMQSDHDEEAARGASAADHNPHAQMYCAHPHHDPEQQQQHYDASVPRYRGTGLNAVSSLSSLSLQTGRNATAAAASAASSTQLATRAGGHAPMPQQQQSQPLEGMTQHALPLAAHTRPVMTKARQIRIAAERLRAVQRDVALADSSSSLPSSVLTVNNSTKGDVQSDTVFTQSHQAQQLRHEEGLIEASLQRLRAERALATVRHAYNEELQQFSKGIARHETVVLSDDHREVNSVEQTAEGSTEAAALTTDDKSAVLSYKQNADSAAVSTVTSDEAARQDTQAGLLPRALSLRSAQSCRRTSRVASHAAAARAHEVPQRSKRCNAMHATDGKGQSNITKGALSSPKATRRGKTGATTKVDTRVRRNNSTPVKKQVTTVTHSSSASRARQTIKKRAASNAVTRVNQSGSAMRAKSSRRAAPAPSTRAKPPAAFPIMPRGRPSKLMQALQKEIGLPFPRQSSNKMQQLSKEKTARRTASAPGARRMSRSGGARRS